MDFDRLTLDEVRQMAKLIDVMGIPAATDEFQHVINVLDGALTKYRQQLAEMRHKAEQHGE